jgi:PAS domain S-box-containing protein
VDASKPQRWLARRFNPALVLWGAALLAASLVVGAAIAGALLWRDMRADSEADVRRLVRLLAQHTVRTVEPVDQGIQQVRRTLVREGFARRALSPERLHEVLRASAATIGPQMLRMVVIDAEGRVLAASDRESVGGEARIEDAWFTNLSRDRSDALFVAVPRASRIGGEQVAPVGRPIFVDGVFAGAVMAALNVEHWKAFQHAVRLTEDWHLALVRDDGSVLASAEPEMPWPEIGPHLPAAGPSEWVGWRQEPADSVLLALHRAGAYPIAAAVAVHAQAVVTPWRHRVWAILSIALPGAGAVLLLGWLGMASVQRARGLSQTLGISQARYRSLVDSSPEGILLAEAGRVVWANRAMLALAGADEATQLAGRRVEELLDGAPHVQGEFEGPPPDEIQRVEHLLRPLRGEPRAVETLIAGGPHMAQDAALQIVVRDISARRAAERALRESEERHRLMVQGAPDCAFLLLDAEGRIGDVGMQPLRPDGAGVLGPATDLQGQPFAALFTAEDAAAGHAQRLLAQAAGETRRAEGEGWCQRSDGTRFWAQWVVSALSGEAQAADGTPRGYHVQLRDVSARRRLQDELRATRREVESLAMAAEAAREREKRRIARELHDELGQVLTVQQLEVDMLGAEAAARAPELAPRIEALRGRIEDALTVTRRISGDLRPLVLDDLGLVAALEWLLGQARARMGIEGQLELQGEPQQLSDEVATTVFRIAQECVTNVLRHAGARHVHIALEIGEQQVRLAVSDDGRGIDRRALRRGLGLRGIEERTRLLGGRFAIGEAAGGGTRVEVRLPCAAAAGAESDSRPQGLAP